MASTLAKTVDVDLVREAYATAKYIRTLIPDSPDKKLDVPTLTHAVDKLNLLLARCEVFWGF